MGIAGTFFLSGPTTQCERMFAGQRLVSTLVYLGALAGTLFFCLAPFVPAFALRIVRAPLVVAVPSPVATSMWPPVTFAPTPDATSRAPPWPPVVLLPWPAVIDTAPPAT